MAQAPTAQELLAQKPAGLHQRLTTGAEDEEDPLLAQTGCAAPYTRLEVRPPRAGCATSSGCGARPAALEARACQGCADVG